MTQPEEKRPSSDDPGRSTRTIVLLVLGVAALTVALFFLARKAPPPVHARSLGARLDLAAGEVTVTEGSTSAKALSATPLGSGAHVATGKGSRALIRTGDGAAVFLRGESEVALVDHGIELVKGEIWLDAPNVDAEATPVKAGGHTITASDAGLSILREGDDVTVYVARSLAVLQSPGGRVEVNAGEQATAKGKNAPTITPVAFWQDWTGGMSDGRPARGAVGSGAGRIYGIDTQAPYGAPARKLGIAKQVVKAVLRDGIAETEVDQTFSNPSGYALEGWYWFTVPADASVSSFALETDGVLVEGEIVEKREAATKYEVAKRQGRDPALLEWVDGKSYRARIYPIPPNGTRRVVLRYTQLLPVVDGKTRYVYPLRSDDPVRFDEFALSVDVGKTQDEVTLATSLDATVEENGKKVTMRRSGYVPRADFQLEMVAKKPPEPVRAWRFEAGADQADYVMMRYVPDVDFTKIPPAKGEVVVVVDTSAGGDESAWQMRKTAAEAVLRALSDEDRFALVALDVKPTVVYPPQGLAPASESDIGQAMEKLAMHATGGASDLGAMFEPALERLHGAEQPAVVYVGDGIPTSGEASADALLDRLRRSLSGSRARLFTVDVGTEARHELLDQLARTGGGQHVRIDEQDESTGQALRLTSAVKTPTITDLEVDLGAGLDQPFYSATGKLARGEELVLLARTHHALPPKVRIKGRVGGKDFTSDYDLRVENGVATALVPRLWAGEYVHRLLGSGSIENDNRAKVLDLGLEYGLMTPYTSFLALDSELAYQQQGIPRRSSKLRGVHLTALTPKSENELASSFAAVSPVAGCSKREAPDAAESQATNREGGYGTRAKGEEGSMGSPAAAPAAAAQAAPTATTAADMPDLHQGRGSLGDSDLMSKPGGGIGSGAGIGASGGLKMGAGAAAEAAPKAAPSPKGAMAVPQKKAKTAEEPARMAAPPPSPPPRDDKKDKNQIAKPTTPMPIPKRVLATCSDAASRPLAERVVLWKKRLKQARNARDLVTQYELARSGCELPDWRDQAALLDLIQARVETEEAATIVLEHFAGEQEAQKYVARAILRRTVDPRIEAAVSRVLFGGRVDWAKVDRDLLDIAKPEDRLKKIREAMLQAPGDPSGDVRLIRVLAEVGERSEALAYGRRLRDRGLETPALSQQLGDVLADAGDNDEALRTYSDIVEFDGESIGARRVLGDIFLRHRWYPEAYRQYKTLTDLDPKSPLAWLRLASAAAGTGRVDEALRIERQVATGEGTPGPDDPRQWAKLWSAARLGALLVDPSKVGATPDAVSRKLKELSVFSGPGTLSILTWEDLDARLALVSTDAKKQDTLKGEEIDAGATGLYSVLSSSGALDRGSWAVRWRSDPRRPVAWSVVVLGWDGKSFSVSRKAGTLQVADKDVSI